MDAPESWISKFNSILKSKVREQTQLLPIIPRRWACVLMRSQGGNRTVAHPVLRRWQSCHIVKDTPWADADIGLSFRTIRWFFGVQWGILRLIVWVNPKQNHLQFDRLITDVGEKWSSFNRYENIGTLSLRVQYRGFIGLFSILGVYRFFFQYRGFIGVAPKIQGLIFHEPPVFGYFGR